MQALAIHRIVWHLSLSAVIVCILRVVFISGRLDWTDHAVFLRWGGGVSTISLCHMNYLPCYTGKAH